MPSIITGLLMLISLSAFANNPANRLEGVTPNDLSPEYSPEVHPRAWLTPINQISQVACHNCYEPEIFSYPLAEALNYTKAIELDVWDEYAFLLGGGMTKNWYVRHNPISFASSGGNHNNCTGDGYLTDCLHDINVWSNSNPGHFPITLFLDKKQRWSTPEEGRSPRDLFDLLYEILGSKLYLPKEQARLNDLKTQTPAQWIWPRAAELRDRIIVVINGGNFIKSSNLFPFNSSNETYNADVNQVQTFDDDTTAFAGPYVFHHDDFKQLPINDIKSSAVFLNSNYSSVIPTLVVNYLSSKKIHNRLLRLWAVDKHSFCSLLPLRVAYLAYYEFEKQNCRSYRIVPMGYTEEELQEPDQK